MSLPALKERVLTKLNFPTVLNLSGFFETYPDLENSTAFIDEDGGGGGEAAQPVRERLHRINFRVNYNTEGDSTYIAIMTILMEHLYDLICPQQTPQQLTNKTQLDNMATTIDTYMQGSIAIMNYSEWNTRRDMFTPELSLLNTEPPLVGREYIDFINPTIFIHNFRTTQTKPNMILLAKGGSVVVSDFRLVQIGTQLEVTVFVGFPDMEKVKLFNF
jgi:hypothetical protein